MGVDVVAWPHLDPCGTVSPSYKTHYKWTEDDDDQYRHSYRKHQKVHLLSPLLNWGYNIRWRRVAVETSVPRYQFIVRYLTNYDHDSGISIACRACPIKSETQIITPSVDVIVMQLLNEPLLASIRELADSADHFYLGRSLYCRLTPLDKYIATNSVSRLAYTCVVLSTSRRLHTFA